MTTCPIESESSISQDILLKGGRSSVNGVTLSQHGSVRSTAAAYALALSHVWIILTGLQLAASQPILTQQPHHGSYCTTICHSGMLGWKCTPLYDTSGTPVTACSADVYRADRHHTNGMKLQGHLHVTCSKYLLPHIGSTGGCIDSVDFYWLLLGYTVLKTRYTQLEPHVYMLLR